MFQLNQTPQLSKRTYLNVVAKVKAMESTAVLGLIFEIYSNKKRF